ncbi:hypothetical protein, partial [Pseudomonas syringae]|uniref:hypothetical protein n=1 Tax=Pseudomonas syringae TaxID=317 RepID=UPI0019672D9D
MTGWPNGIVPFVSEQCIGRINKQLNFCNGRKWEMFIAGFLVPMRWYAVRDALGRAAAQSHALSVITAHKSALLSRWHRRR